MELNNSLIEKVQHYQPTPKRLAQVQDVTLLFLVGISGAGKNAITQHLLSRYPDDYHYVISHTTRAPRANHGIMEQGGVEYHFVSFDEAEAMIDNHDFVEAKIVHQHNVYGTSMAELEAASNEHKIAMGDIEIQGVQAYVDLGLNAKPVFILPPSYDVWQQRLMTRYDDDFDEADWRNRMHTAREEIEHALNHDYFYFVVNDNLSDTVEIINAIAHGEGPAERRSPAATEVARAILQGIQAAIG